MMLRYVAKALRLVPLVVLGILGTHCSSGEFDENVAENAEAITVPSGFTDQVIASGLSNPTTLSFAPDGRIFVAQQAGQLRVIKNGSLLTTPFVSLTVNSLGERGLLGIAFDPNFASNGFVYLYYTATTPSIHNRVSRFTANGDVAVAGSELVLFDLPTLSATNHNGGALTFGPDGKLYVAVGENAVGSNAQSLNTPLGKILRFNADGSIPSDNPFFGSTTGINRSIWALGLRNPFTFAFQPGTGRFFINDVGQNTWEEIDDGIVGSNYGWPTTEGMTTNPAFRSPLFVYGHGSSGTTGCAISGGAFYNPGTANFPSSFVGKYFFADYCSNWIRVFDPAAGTASSFATALSSPVDLDVGPDGRLYYVMRGGGVVGAIGFSTGQAPSITTQPASQTVSTGQTATFSVAATGSQPLGYQWQRGTTNIAGATSSSYSLVAASGDNGATFRVVVSNGFGSVTSNSATLTVTTNAPPTGTITAPAAGATYRGGDTINYAGTGTDPETGTLPASAFTWEVVFHHDTHTHPFLGPITGATSGSFTIPRTGEFATNVWYRIHLTVRDPAGLTHTTTRDIVPQLTTLSFASTPSGLGLTLDGIPLTTPASVQSVVGMTRTLGAPSPQVLGGTTYAFSAWSDGGAATHDVNAPATNTTYTATYTPTASGGGLSGQYFDNQDFTTPRITRVDPTLNFDWGSGSPDPSVGSDTFSVRWTGTITPRFSQAYTLYTTSDDGIRVTFNGTVLINNFTDHSPTENSGVTPVLTAGQAYPILIEYYENGGGAVARLSWSSSSEPKQIVPSTQLSPGSASGFPIRINYQLAGAATPSGYLADTGLLFGDRGGGRSYGWNVDTTDVCRDRGVNSNQLLDTLCHFHSGAAWELALPNGTYNVLVSIGDPSFASTHTVIVEGTTYWNALSLAANQFGSTTRAVTVSDGRLTITQGGAADKSTRINYVEVSLP
jgi:glucose/arabinose dehydrogenase